jgi:hypothetical protein
MTIPDADIQRIHSQIQAMKKIAENLQATADDFPALACNLARIIASLKMLELNIPPEE